MGTQLNRAELYERLRGFRTALLTTVSADGYLHTRPMMAQELEPDGDLWFVSALNSVKISEIRGHPQVGVVYYHDSDDSYVSLSGNARIVTDRALIKQKWQEAWRAWFPEGPDQSNLCLISIDPRQAEYWEPSKGRIRVTFDRLRSYLTGQPPALNPPVSGEVK